MFQLELIAAVRNKAQQDTRIDAVMMYGSFTQNCGDAFSDVEFYIFVNNESFNEFNTDNWISQIHPYTMHFHNEYGTEVVIFDNLVRGEFHFMPEKGMAIVETFKTVGHFSDIDSMCLCDKEGKLKKYLQICVEFKINRHSKESIEFAANNFINMAIYGINVFKRGEFARSVECLSLSQKYYLQLIRLKENRTDHWVNPTKCLEKEISAESYHAYSNCYTDVKPKNIIRAYENIIANTQLLLKSFVSQYGINDYDTLLNRIYKYLKQ